MLGKAMSSSLKPLKQAAEGGFKISLESIESLNFFR